MNRRVRILVLAFCMASPLIVVFQNCSRQFQAISGTSSVQSSSFLPTSLPPPDPSIAPIPSNLSYFDIGSQIAANLQKYVTTTSAPDQFVLPTISNETGWTLKTVSFISPISAYVVLGGPYPSLNQSEFRLTKFNSQTATLTPVVDFQFTAPNAYSLGFAILNDSTYVIYNAPDSTTQLLWFTRDSGQTWTATDTSALPSSTVWLGKYSLTDHNQLALEVTDSVHKQMVQMILGADNKWSEGVSVDATDFFSPLGSFAGPPVVTSPLDSHLILSTQSNSSTTFKTFFPTAQTQTCNLPTDCPGQAIYYTPFEQNMMVTCQSGSRVVVYTSQDHCQTYNNVFDQSTITNWTMAVGANNNFLARFQSSQVTLGSLDPTNQFSDGDKVTPIFQRLLIDFSSQPLAQVTVERDPLEALTQKTYWSAWPTMTYLFRNLILQHVFRYDSSIVDGKTVLVLPQISSFFAQFHSHLATSGFADNEFQLLAQDASLVRNSLTSSDFKSIRQDDQGRQYLVATNYLSPPFIVLKDGVNERFLLSFQYSLSSVDYPPELDVSGGQLCAAGIRYRYGLVNGKMTSTGEHIYYVKTAVTDAASATIHELDTGSAAISSIAVDCTTSHLYFISTTTSDTFNIVDFNSGAWQKVDTGGKVDYLGAVYDKVLGGATIALVSSVGFDKQVSLSTDGGQHFSTQNFPLSQVVDSTNSLPPQIVLVNGTFHFFIRDFGPDPANPVVRIHDTIDDAKTGGLTDTVYALPATVSGVSLSIGYSRSQAEIQVMILPTDNTNPGWRLRLGPGHPKPQIESLTQLPQPNLSQGPLSAEPVWFAGQKIL